MSKKYITIVVVVALAIIGSAYTVAKVAEWQRTSTTSTIVDTTNQIPFKLVGNNDGYGCYFAVDLPFIPTEDTWTMVIPEDIRERSVQVLKDAYADYESTMLDIEVRNIERYERYEQMLEAHGPELLSEWGWERPVPVEWKWSSYEEYYNYMMIDSVTAIPGSYEIDGTVYSLTAGWYYQADPNWAEASEIGIDTFLGPNNLLDARNFMANLAPPSKHLTLTINDRKLEFDLTGIEAEWEAQGCQNTTAIHDELINDTLSYQ